jgi:hypothetical protein
VDGPWNLLFEHLVSTVKINTVYIRHTTMLKGLDGARCCERL